MRPISAKMMELKLILDIDICFSVSTSVTNIDLPFVVLVVTLVVTSVIHYTHFDTELHKLLLLLIICTTAIA